MAYTTNASDIVYSFIIDNINAGIWKPGDKILSENLITEKLNVSRVAVRQATERLAAMSVLKKIKGSGTYVGKLDVNMAMFSLFPGVAITNEEMDDIRNMRKCFEPSIMPLFMENCSDEDIAELDACYERMLTTTDSNDFITADFDFHQKIAKSTRNVFVIQISNMIMDIMFRQQQKLFTSIGPQVGVEHHGNILQAIKKRDTEMAVLCMKRHMEALL